MTVLSIVLATNTQSVVICCKGCLHVNTTQSHLTFLESLYVIDDSTEIGQVCLKRLYFLYQFITDLLLIIIYINFDPKHYS